MDKTKLIGNVKDLDIAIVAWGKAGKKWTEQGHILAVSALTLTAAHNDVGPVNRLYKAMPAGTKTTSMTSWLLAYGALQANTDTATKADKPFVYTKDKDYKLDEAARDPWFNHKPEPAPDEAFDVQKALMAVLKKAQGKELIHGELLSHIQAALAVPVTALDSVEDKDDTPVPATAE